MLSFFGFPIRNATTSEVQNSRAPSSTPTSEGFVFSQSFSYLITKNLGEIIWFKKYIFNSIFRNKKNNIILTLYPKFFLLSIHIGRLHRPCHPQTAPGWWVDCPFQPPAKHPLETGLWSYGKSPKKNTRQTIKLWAIAMVNRYGG